MMMRHYLHPSVSRFGVGVVVLFWQCATRLAESELLVSCVELGNDDSRRALCLGLPLFVLFRHSVSAVSVMWC